MRIVAGKYKRTPLKTLESNDTRPTKDMVKEALFSSIHAIIILTNILPDNSHSTSRRYRS